MNIAKVLPLHLELKLPECLHEGHPLDVPDGAAQLLNKMAASSQYTNGCLQICINIMKYGIDSI